MANRKLTSETKIKIISNVRGSTSFRDMDDRLMLFPKMGSFKMLPLTTIESVYNDCPQYITNGNILLDKDVYEYLDIDKEIYGKILNESELTELLDGTAEDIEEKMTDAPSNVKENLARIAKEKGIDSKKKINTIKKTTNFEIDSEY